MKSSLSAAGLALAAGVVLVLSLGLKVLAETPRPAEAGATPTERIGRFLAEATGQPAEKVDNGWRIRRGDCWMMAFPSGPLGTLDVDARGHGRKTERVGYVHNGKVSDVRPTAAYAFEIIGYHLERPFRPLQQPSYVVLVAPKACGAWPALPWERFG